MSESSTESDSTDCLNVAFWNVQNLFDLDASPIAAELGFTAMHGWDRRTLRHKIGRTGQIIRDLFDGRGPDLLGLCEIENVRLVELLLEAVGRDDLKLAVGPKSPEQNLDTALIYSDRILELDTAACADHQFHWAYPTRDAFEGRFVVRSTGSELTVIVTHCPSRSETEPTDGLRWAAAHYLKQQLERILKLPRREFLQLRDSAMSAAQVQDRWRRPVLVMGDFNDEPWHENLTSGLHASYALRNGPLTASPAEKKMPSYRTYASMHVPLFNPMWRLLAQPDTGSTVRSDGPQPQKLFDQMLISVGLLGPDGKLMLQRNSDDIPVVDIVRPKSMTDEHDCPVAFDLETGRGVSDHFPIVSTIRINP